MLSSFVNNPFNARMMTIERQKRERRGAKGEWNSLSGTANGASACCQRDYNFLLTQVTFDDSSSIMQTLITSLTSAARALRISVFLSPSIILFESHEKCIVTLTPPDQLILASINSDSGQIGISTALFFSLFITRVLQMGSDKRSLILDLKHRWPTEWKIPDFGMI